MPGRYRDVNPHPLYRERQFLACCTMESILFYRGTYFVVPKNLFCCTEVPIVLYQGDHFVVPRSPF
jgi:hypothetical protein